MSLSDPPHPATAASRSPGLPGQHTGAEPRDVPPGGAIVSAAERAVEAVQDRAVDLLTEIKPRLRGWLHAGAAPLAFVAFLVVLVLAESTLARVGVAVFMVSALVLFTTSAVYHVGTWTPRRTKLLKRVDHANIFVLIAGSSTPFALLLLTRQHAVSLMAMMWGGAVLGVFFKVFWIDAPRWVHVPLYVVLGWAPVVFAADFLDEGQDAALVLLGVGGLLYSIGALVYALKWPNPSAAYFGFHEVFHAFTIAAFVAHFSGVTLLVDR